MYYNYGFAQSKIFVFYLLQTLFKQWMSTMCVQTERVDNNHYGMLGMYVCVCQSLYQMLNIENIR